MHKLRRGSFYTVTTPWWVYVDPSSRKENWPADPPTVSQYTGLQLCASCGETENEAKGHSLDTISGSCLTYFPWSSSRMSLHREVFFPVTKTSVLRIADCDSTVGSITIRAPGVSCVRVMLPLMGSSTSETSGNREDRLPEDITKPLMLAKSLCNSRVFSRNAHREGYIHFV